MSAMDMKKIGGQVEVFKVYDDKRFVARPIKKIWSGDRARVKGETVRVRIVVTSDKQEEKVRPLVQWVCRQFRVYSESRGVRLDEMFQFEVIARKVASRIKDGEQPIYPMGMQMAYWRIEDCVDTVLVDGCDLLLFASMESDFSELENGYDAANVLVVELRTGVNVGWRSRGPFGDKALLEKVKKSGFVDDRGLLYRETYGSFAQEKWGVPSSNWHAYVVKEGYSRQWYVEESGRSAQLDVSAIMDKIDGDC